nr:hypothetical protein RNT25_00001 [arsenite-oxidising bacterium NT-25]
MDASGRLFGHALDCVTLLGEPAWRGLQALLDLREQDFLFLGGRVGQHILARLGACAEQDVHGGIAAIVENHVGQAAVGPLKDLVSVLPILDERLALHREDRNTGFGDRCGGMVLGRKDVAGSPAHIGTERLQRLDQDPGLDGHVQRAGDPGTLQRLALAKLLAAGHEAGHFRFGDVEFLAAIGGKSDISHDVVLVRAHQALQLGFARPEASPLAFWRLV